ncbi:MAG: hypothetical protein JWN70_7174 [Planctomycetaceae bacterium]|nr:hypothetical protein [Planctomycetaceae bacterium]
MRLLYLIIFMLISYVSMYFFLVQRKAKVLNGGLSRMRVYCVERYSSHRQIDAWLTRMFEPLNYLDHKVRPGYWTYDEYP